MKRHGNLWPQVISFAALLRAAEQACKGKRFRPGVAAFHFDLEPELWKLHEELSTKTYRPGAYRTFFICEPKPRQISAAPYRDRVVHHALVNVLEPVYERTFVHDSYACRKGKGTHQGILELLPVQPDLTGQLHQHDDLADVLPLHEERLQDSMVVVVALAVFPGVLVALESQVGVRMSLRSG